MITFNDSFLSQSSNMEIENENIVFSENKGENEEKVDSQTLIKYHKIYGNRWKQISNHLPHTYLFAQNIRSDSFIKNMFYTLARKALRKINVYIELNSKTKNRKEKIFKLNFVFKLANLAESQRISDSKEFLDSLRGFYTKLLYNLLEVGNVDQEIFKKMQKMDSNDSQKQEMRKHIDCLIQNLKIIQKIFIEQNLIKKGRTKKKFPKKGLIQKAYTSKAFQRSIDQTETLSFQSLSTTHSKQYKDQQISSQWLKEFDMVCELQAFPQTNTLAKNDLDKCLEEKAFDPILFE